MAKLIKCKGCGADLYSGAKVCPQCGKKNKKPVGLIIIAIIILLIIISVISGKIKSKNEKKVELKWPDSGIAKLLPVPEFKYGKVDMESEDYVSIEVYLVSVDDYDEYVNACKDAGFIVDYSAHENTYTADDDKGNSLTLVYNKDDEQIDIRLSAYKEPSTEEPESESESAKQTEAEPAESEKTESEAKEPETEPAKEEVKSDKSFREWVDQYEAFMDKYVDFMKAYDASDASMLAKYTELMTEYAEFMSATENYKQEDYSVDDWKYYMDAQKRVLKKLSEVQ